MSKNQPSLQGLAVGLNSGISSFTQTQNGRYLLRSIPGLPASLFPSAMVGVTGFEPVTLRLSSACSNQLSYTPMDWLMVDG